MNIARRQHLGRRICSELDRMPALQPNAVLYFVICEYKGDRYVAEREVCNMTREKTLSHIRSGDLTDIVSIIETEFTDQGLSSRDVTASMLMEAELQRSMLGLDEPEPIDRQANAFDHARKLRVEA